MNLGGLAALGYSAFYELELYFRLADLDVPKQSTKKVQCTVLVVLGQNSYL